MLNAEKKTAYNGKRTERAIKLRIRKSHAKFKYVVTRTNDMEKRLV